MKRPGAIRDRVLSEVNRMLEVLRIQVSCYHAEEREVMDILTEPHKREVVIDLANNLMKNLGYQPQSNGREPIVNDPRFDKTRRAYNEKFPKKEPYDAKT